MRAGGFDRQQRPRHFVFTLRTAFKTVKTVLNAPLQGLVIASLKVQAINPFKRTPITTVSCFLARLSGRQETIACEPASTECDQTAGHRHAIPFSHKQ